MSCGEKWRLTRRYGYGNGITWALIGGSAFHKWTEHYDDEFLDEKPVWKQVLDATVQKSIDKGEITSIKDIKPTGRKSKAYPDKRNYDWWLVEGQKMCDKYIHWRNDPENHVYNMKTPGLVEERIDFVLGDVPNIGYIDRLIPGAVIDIKTGKAPSQVLQLATYAWAINNSPNKPDWVGEITTGYYYLAETGELSGPYDLTEYSGTFLNSLYEQAVRGIANGVFLPNPTAFCASCEVKNMCRLMGGRPPITVPLLEKPVKEEKS